MSQEAIYALLLGLVFFTGNVSGAVIVLWSFAKDKSVQRVNDDEVIIKKDFLKKLSKKIDDED